MADQKEEKAVQDDVNQAQQQESQEQDETITEVIDADDQTEAQESDPDPLQAELDKANQEKKKCISVCSVSRQNLTIIRSGPKRKRG